jgi:hypothetical protein
MKKENEARITIITNREFRHKVKSKALKEDRTITQVITDLLTKWLKGE